jgi:hypothetical protein
MDEYICLKGGIIKKKFKKGSHAKDNHCGFIYEKCLDVNLNSNTEKKDVHVFCSNKYFCPDKSLFKFENKINKCICGKILLDKKQRKCLNCELSEMADKKAEEEINREWS